MLRIGIVGSDNSHALAYATLLNIEPVAGQKRGRPGSQSAYASPAIRPASGPALSRRSPWSH